MYLYVGQENDFNRVPTALLRNMGPLELVMGLEIDATTRLARVNATDVLRELAEQGYFLQLPPKLRPDLYFGD